jgi:hypothetical protein
MEGCVSSSKPSTVIAAGAVMEKVVPIGNFLTIEVMVFLLKKWETPMPIPGKVFPRWVKVRITPKRLTGSLF